MTPQRQTLGWSQGVVTVEAKAHRNEFANSDDATARLERRSTDPRQSGERPGGKRFRRLQFG